MLKPLGRSRSRHSPFRGAVVLCADSTSRLDKQAEAFVLTEGAPARVGCHREAAASVYTGVQPAEGGRLFDVLFRGVGVGGPLLLAVSSPSPANPRCQFKA
ncbi:hypothetical protein SKAU_G00202390 [Synaphobranchus kaupii]|uniref:Uncharacterized protein n=1 Tax=Synaphobranchus kaupii TaxID=118154 RepID=A0A9Q1IYI5_SYNKA|nr:hypothetical protein SKAU_G00202390 [Synaphobranchus kaupii]